METSTDKQLRAQLIKHLEGGNAFMPIDDILRKIPFEKAGIVPDGLPYSFWQQLYHLRISQYDILDFSRNPEYSSLDWPKDYWPDEPAPRDEKEWNETVEAYFAERKQLADLISDPENNLYEPFPHGSGQTLLREALLVIEHNAYHIGQLLVILRLLGVSI